jgi:hypothetical protein
MKHVIRHNDGVEVAWGDENRVVVWLYEPSGEPAFELEFTIEGNEGEKALAMTATPMHMDGSHADPVKVVAR